MGKDYTAMQLLAFTTGAGIALGTGTNVQIGNITIGSVASTIIIKGGPAGTATLLSVITSQDFANPIQLPAGTATMTSSGGSGTVAYRAI